MKKYDSIQIWDLANYDSDLNIVLSQPGRDYIRKKILKRYSLLKYASKEININYWSLIDNLRGRRAIDFWNLLRLVKKLSLDKNIIQREIEGLVIRRVKIRNVHFPVQCDPVFVSLFINLLGDGGARGGKGSGYFHYAEPEAYQLIQKKINYILGITPYQKGESVPRILVFLMMKYFGIESVATKKSVFPNKILKADRLTRLAGLTAFVNDEGTITTSFIQIYSSNYKLLSGVRTLAQSLDYTVSKISQRKDKKIYLFRINSIRRFYEDYKKLIKKYPEVKLINRKEKVLRILDLISEKPKRSRKDVFNLIIKELQKGERTIYELCETTRLSQTGIYGYLRELLRDGIIRRKLSNSKTRYIYTLS